MRSVSTIIVEPRTLLREGLVSLLRHSGFRVISAVPTLDKVPQAALGHASLLTIGASSETAEALDYLNRSSSAARISGRRCAASTSQFWIRRKPAQRSSGT